MISKIFLPTPLPCTVNDYCSQNGKIFLKYYAVEITNYKTVLKTNPFNTQFLPLMAHSDWKTTKSQFIPAVRNFINAFTIPFTWKKVMQIKSELISSWKQFKFSTF